MHIKRKGNRVNVNSSSFNRKAAEESVYEYYEGIVIVGRGGGGVLRSNLKKKKRKKTVRLHDRFLPTYIADIGHHIILK